MKTKRKLFSYLMAVVLVSGTAPSVSAFAENSDSKSYEQLFQEAWERDVKNYNEFVYDYPDDKCVISEQAIPGVSSYVEDEVLVAFAKYCKYEDALCAVKSAKTVSIKDELKPGFDQNDIDRQSCVVLHVNEGYTVQDAIDELYESREIFDYAQPNWNYFLDDENSLEHVLDASANDAFVSNGTQWNFAAVDIANAWDLAGCNGNVSVGVIDTGVDTDHPDLVSNLDLSHCYNTTTQRSGNYQDVEDANGHGTHVSGIIAAVANNGIGVAGLSKNAKIVPVKMGLQNSNELKKGIEYLTNLRISGTVSNLKVINISGGYYAEEGLDSNVTAKIAQAENAGIVVVCSAGNEGAEYSDVSLYKDTTTNYLKLHSPSDYELSVAVCATNQDGSRALLSSYNNSKNISAPGISIRSTYLQGGYADGNGTSQAAPCVSAVAALVFACNPSLTPAQVRDILYTTASDMTGTTTDIEHQTQTLARGYDPYTGHGLVNASYAVEKAYDLSSNSTRCTWTRHNGATRYETACNAVAAQYGSASTVIVASGENFPDAMSCPGFAGIKGAPVLLTQQASLPDCVRDEISRLGATKVYIMGGTSAVSDGVKSSIQSIPCVTSVSRIQGSTRSATAIAAYQAASGWSSTAIVVYGHNYPDALCIGSYAYASKSPVFLTEQDGTLSAATVSAIRGGGFSKVLLVGGTSAVSNTVKTQLGSSYSYGRIDGSTRYQTSNTAALWCTGGATSAVGIAPSVTLGASGMTVASGTSFPDALAAAAPTGKRSSVILLTEDSANGRYTADNFAYAKRSVISQGHLAGGTSAIPSTLARYYMQKVG